MNAMRHMTDRSEALLSRDELDQLWAISSDLQNERAAFKKQNTHHLGVSSIVEKFLLSADLAGQDSVDSLKV